MAIQDDGLTRVLFIGTRFTSRFSSSPNWIGRAYERGILWEHNDTVYFQPADVTTRIVLKEGHWLDYDKKTDRITHREG